MRYHKEPGARVDSSSWRGRFKAGSWLLETVKASWVPDLAGELFYDNFGCRCGEQCLLGITASSRSNHPHFRLVLGRATEGLETSVTTYQGSKACGPNERRLQVTWSGWPCGVEYWINLLLHQDGAEEAASSSTRTRHGRMLVYSRRVCAGGCCSVFLFSEILEFAWHFCSISTMAGCIISGKQPHHAPRRHAKSCWVWRGQQRDLKGPDPNCRVFL
jgi:hypothetical protein